VFADDTLTVQQKEVISYMLDPLADDDGAVDLIGQELPEATDDGQALTQVGFRRGECRGCRV